MVNIIRGAELTGRTAALARLEMPRTPKARSGTDLMITLILEILRPRSRQLRCSGKGFQKLNRGWTEVEQTPKKGLSVVREFKDFALRLTCRISNIMVFKVDKKVNG